MMYINTGPWPYYIGFTSDPAAFGKEMKRLKVDGQPRFLNENAGATTHFLDNHGTSTAIICIEPYSRKLTKEQYAAMIAHEAVHVVQDMRRNLGDLGEEAEAYLAQMMVQECLQFAWKSTHVRRTAPKP